jgi:hypothetical protein
MSIERTSRMSATDRSAAATFGPVEAMVSIADAASRQSRVGQDNSKALMEAFVMLAISAFSAQEGGLSAGQKPEEPIFRTSDFAGQIGPRRSAEIVHL